MTIEEVHSLQRERDDLRAQLDRLNQRIRALLAQQVEEAALHDNASALLSDHERAIDAGGMLVDELTRRFHRLVVEERRLRLLVEKIK